MAKPKNLEQLRAEKEQVETQLAQEQHKLWKVLWISTVYPQGYVYRLWESGRHAPQKIRRFPPWIISNYGIRPRH